MDYRCVDIRHNDPAAISDEQHIRLWREILEEKIAPYVTLTETEEILEFKGKQSYLMAQTSYETTHTVIALQCLYQLEAARKVGDIGKVIRMAFTFDAHLYEIQYIWQWGMGRHEAYQALLRNHTRRRLTREGKTKLSDVPDLILQVAYAKHTGKKDWLQCVTQEVVRHRGGAAVSSKKVSEELKKRGIAE